MALPVVEEECLEFQNVKNHTNLFCVKIYRSGIFFLSQFVIIFGFKSGKYRATWYFAVFEYILLYFVNNAVLLQIWYFQDFALFGATPFLSNIMFV
jgi:hypothetical protein